MFGPTRTEMALTTLAVLCSILSGCAENPRQNGRAGVEPVAAPSEDLVVPSRTSMATAAVRHAYEERVASRPELGETPPTVDPRYPGGDESLDQEAMIAHVARAIDARIAPRTDDVLDRGGVMISISDVSMDGDDRGRVTVRFIYEDERALAGVTHLFTEYLLEYRDDRWEVAGIGMRGIGN